MLFCKFFTGLVSTDKYVTSFLCSFFPTSYLAEAFYLLLCNRSQNYNGSSVTLSLMKSQLDINFSFRNGCAA